jgi:hypothetical protein
VTSEVVPISSIATKPSRTDYSKYGYAFDGDGGFIVTPGQGFLALSFLAAADKRQARAVVGKQYRSKADDDGLELCLAMWLMSQLDSDAPVHLDYRATSIELSCAPDRLREAADWLVRVRAIVVNAPDTGDSRYVWVNPSLGYSPDTDPFQAAKRHRFPRIDVDASQTPYVPFIEEFEDIVWAVAQLCAAELPDNGLCDWDLGFGLCPQHATDADRAREESKQRRHAERLEQDWRKSMAERRNELAARRQRPCPACNAQPGEHCRTATGGRAREPHTSRSS